MAVNVIEYLLFKDVNIMVADWLTGVVYGTEAGTADVFVFVCFIIQIADS